MSRYASKAEAQEVLKLSIEKQSHGDLSLPASTKCYYMGALFDECFSGGGYYGWGITDAGWDLPAAMRKHLRKKYVR